MTTEVSSAVPASRSLVRQLRLPAPALIALALVAPSVVWAGIDRSIWWWDQSLYASGSVDLWATLRLRTRIWPDAMAHVLGVWPPAISWIGQFFVPFGGLFGSDELALLLSVELAFAVAVALLYVTGLRVAGGRAMPALAGATLLASAPLLVNISHFYFVEVLQTLAVAWVLLILVSARRWHVSLTVVQLVAAMCFGLLVKLSTPAYVAVPAAAALLASALAARARARPRWWYDNRFLASSALALLLGYGAARWYASNFHTAWHHAQSSAQDAIWGPSGSFTFHLSYWLPQFGDALFLPDVAWVLLALLAVAAGLAVRRRGRRVLRNRREPLLVLAGSLGTPVGALVLLSTQVNQDPRYLTAVTPAIALGLVAVLRILDVRAISALVVALFVGQFALMTLQSFSSSAPRRYVYAKYHYLPVSNEPVSAALDRIVRYACTHGSGARGLNTIGASYAWLNQNGLDYRSKRLFALEDRSCPWNELNVATLDAKDAWAQLQSSHAPFFLTVDYDNPENPVPQHLAAQTSFRDRLNQSNAGVLRAALRSGVYAAVPALRRDGLVLLRRRNP